MRASELLDRPAGVERADHVCWAYADDASFEEAALRFLTAGLAGGHRLMWVGDGAEERLRRSAIAALAAVPDQRSDLLRREHLADDFIASGSGFAALCAYRSDEVPADTVADVASVHPVSHSDGTRAALRLWFQSGALLVAGDVDRFTAERLARLLGTTPIDAPVVELDLSRLEFIDLAGVRVIAAWAEHLRGRSTELLLTGASRLFHRMWDILAPDGVPAVRFAEAGG